MDVAALTEAVSMFASCSIQDGREDHISESAVENMLSMDLWNIIILRIGRTVDLMAAASVCRQWRAATANPNLWYDIRFCGPIIERLTDCRLESILKRADGKLTRLSIQTFGNGIPVKPLPRGWYHNRKTVAEFSWRAPISPNIMPLILHASRERRLNYLDLRGCLEIELYHISKFLADYPEAKGIVGRRRRAQKIKVLKVANTDNNYFITPNTLRKNVKRLSVRNCKDEIEVYEDLIEEYDPINWRDYY